TGTVSTFAVGGQRVVCVEAFTDTPDSLSGGETVSHPAIGYALSRWLPGTTGTQSHGSGSDSAANDLSAAVYAYVNGTGIAPGGNLSQREAVQDQVDGNIAEAMAEHPGAAAALDSIASETAAFMGPYSADAMAWNVTVDAPTQGTVDGVGARSAAGNWMSGRPITVTIDGPAVFTDTGTNSWSGTTGSGPLSLGFRATGNGDATVSQSVGGLPATEVVLYRNGSAQDTVTWGSASTSTGGSAAFPMVFDYFPEATTDTTVITATDAGQQVADTVKITGGKPNSTIRGESVLYGRFDSPQAVTDTAPADAPIVGRVEFEARLDANGDATVTTGTVAAPAEGYYVWVEELFEDEGESPRNRGFQGKFGQPTETTLIYPKPAMTSKASSQTAMTGTGLSDDVTVLGTIRDADGLGPIANVLTGGAYGPVEPVDGSCADADFDGAPLAQAVELNVTRSQQYFPGVGAFTPAEGGCYSYGYTLTATNSQGEVIWTVEHEAGETEQTALVVEPKMRTQINAHLVEPGESFSDLILVEGTAGNGGTVTASLYGPVAPDPEEVCDLGVEEWTRLVESGEAPLHHSEDVAFTGDGPVTTSEIAVDEPGCYTFAEHAVFDDVDHPFDTPPGEETETGLVADLRLATTAFWAGDKVMADKVDLTGTQGVHGTLTGVLLQADAVDGKCDGVDWTQATEVGRIDPVETDDDLAQLETTGVELRSSHKDQCGTWVITWTSDGGKPALKVVDGPGVPAETLVRGADEPTLPGTGLPLDKSLLAIALGLLGAGGAALAVQRRRRDDDAPVIAFTGSSTFSL
ncbi:MAG: hypothetical protein QM621_09215, partial [Aeromicrobium sp.]|uniref:hypothetical protein n=1 Tax=Aeromicrobium sp. TaxID=1871063 RepID=UPI0039E4485E